MISQKISAAYLISIWDKIKSTEKKDNVWLIIIALVVPTCLLSGYRYYFKIDVFASFRSILFTLLFVLYSFFRFSSTQYRNEKCRKKIIKKLITAFEIKGDDVEITTCDKESHSYALSALNFNQKLEYDPYLFRFFKRNFLPTVKQDSSINSIYNIYLGKENYYFIPAFFDKPASALEAFLKISIEG